MFSQLSRDRYAFANDIEVNMVTSWFNDFQTTEIVALGFMSNLSPIIGETLISSGKGDTFGVFHAEN